MKKLLSVGAALLAGGALLGAGCNPVANLQQKVAEKAIEGAINKESGGQAKVDLNGDKGVTFRDAKTGDFTAFGEDLAFPEDFPKEIPRYANAKAIAIMIKGDKSEASFSESTGDSLEKVVKWFEDTIKGQGFTLASTMEAGGTKVVAYEKGTIKVTASMSANEDNNQTTITIDWQSEE
jgi:hypothetical protein